MVAIKVEAPVHFRVLRSPGILKLLANGSEQVRVHGTLKGTGSKSLMASPVSKQACITVELTVYIHVEYLSIAPVIYKACS